jgi:hypothetical protein
MNPIRSRTSSSAAFDPAGADSTVWISNISLSFVRYGGNAPPFEEASQFPRREVPARFPPREVPGRRRPVTVDG